MDKREIHQILTAIALVSFMFIAMFFTVVSIVLNYHWTKYGIEAGQIKKIKRLYFGIALTLGILMILMLLAIL